MKHGRIIAASTTMTLGLMATPALTHVPPAGDMAVCNALTLDPEAFKSREDAVTLPQDWAGFATAGRDWIAISTQARGTLCIDIAWYDSTDSFDRFNDRFIGFEWSALEAWGYVLIDRTGTGSSIDTGVKPVFSPDGQYFAMVQLSDAGWGGLEGFAVYSVNDVGIEPVHVDKAIPRLADWRIDGWEGADGERCLRLSGVNYARVEDGDPVRETERQWYVARSNTGWKLEPGRDCRTL